MMTGAGFAINVLRKKDFRNRLASTPWEGDCGYPGSVQIAASESIGRRLLPRMVRLPPDKDITEQRR